MIFSVNLFFFVLFPLQDQYSDLCNGPHYVQYVYCEVITENVTGNFLFLITLVSFVDQKQ